MDSTRLDPQLAKYIKKEGDSDGKGDSDSDSDSDNENYHGINHGLIFFFQILNCWALTLLRLVHSHRM